MKCLQTTSQPSSRHTSMKPWAAVGMGIPMGIPTGMGMGWVWGLKFNPHGSPDETVK